MLSERTPARLGLLAAGFGVVANVLTGVLLLAVPRYALSGAAMRTYLETWFDPISTVGQALTFVGTPLLAAAFGFYLVRSRDATTKDALTGFAPSGVVFAAVVTLVNWAVSAPSLRPETVEFAIQFVRLAGLFLGATLLGALVGETVRERAEASAAESPQPQHEQ
ncbi:hypothetical protein [Halorussus amylolyticus]|uniref:hypothetical protein n=1 Tax=Halorussus amylolyticus TaxID=1126242 RepID=UPI00104B6F19|nr:hypothetical protein [Halorussus amylolyticus]